MSDLRCRHCERPIVDGELCWADDFKVIDITGERATFRNEVRYTCDDCAAVTA